MSSPAGEGTDVDMRVRAEARRQSSLEKRKEREASARRVPEVRSEGRSVKSNLNERDAGRSSAPKVTSTPHPVEPRLGSRPKSTTGKANISSRPPEDTNTSNTSRADLKKNKPSAASSTLLASGEICSPLDSVYLY